MNYEELILKAKAANLKRDTVDRQSGYAAPGDRGLAPHLEVASAAIEAGIRMGDWDCIAEGLVMLHDAIPSRSAFAIEVESYSGVSSDGSITVYGPFENRRAAYDYAMAHGMYEGHDDGGVRFWSIADETDVKTPGEDDE